MAYTENPVLYRSAAFRGMMEPDTGVSRWIAAGNSPDQLMHGNVTVIKRDKRVVTAVARLPTDGHNDSCTVLVKRFRHKALWRAVYAPLGRHRAQRVWQMSRTLRHLDVPVPQPIAYFVKRRGRRWGTSYYLCEYLIGVENLFDSVTRDNDAFERMSDNGLLAVIMRAIACMHANGITHGDLKWVNILVDTDNTAAWFVDLDGTKEHGVYAERRAARDMARFVVSGFEAGFAVDVLRPLLQWYCEARKLNLVEFERTMASRINVLVRRKRGVLKQDVRQ